MLSVLHPKFSGMLGEALNVAARWSGDVVSTYFTHLSLFISSVSFFFILLVSGLLQEGGGGC